MHYFYSTGRTAAAEMRLFMSKISHFQMEGKVSRGGSGYRQMRTNVGNGHMRIARAHLACLALPTQLERYA